MSTPYSEGDVIHGHKLGKKIDETSQRTLFEATSVDFGRLALVELWHRDSAEKIREAFELMKRLSRVRDPNIARVYDLGITDAGALLIILEHPGHTPLREYLAGLREHNMARAYRLGRQVIDTVRELNDQSNGIIILSGLGAGSLYYVDSPNQQASLFLCGWHRYVLEEVFADRRGLEDAGILHLDPDYTSPEYIQREERSEAGQQYIIALVICELLGGEAAPAEKEDPIAKLIKHVQQGMDIRAILPALSPNLQAPLGRALALEPGDRHPSLEAFGEAMDMALHEQPTPPQHPGAIDRWTLVDNESWDHGPTLMANPKGPRYVEGSTRGAEEPGDNIGGRQGARFRTPGRRGGRLALVVMGIAALVIAGALIYGLIVVWSMANQFFGGA